MRDMSRFRSTPTSGGTWIFNLGSRTQGSRTQDLQPESANLDGQLSPTVPRINDLPPTPRLRTRVVRPTTQRAALVNPTTREGRRDTPGTEKEELQTVDRIGEIDQRAAVHVRRLLTDDVHVYPGRESAA